MSKGETLNDVEQEHEEVDPINDIIDYLVRCAKISFKNAHVDENEVKTSDKIRIACELYNRSPTDFLMQFGKYLAPYHLQYFAYLEPKDQEKERYQECITHLKRYHSDDIRHKRVRNRRYKALQKFQEETDHFSEKQMMYRNPLLYEQLVGQYLTEEEIKERDGVDRENLTFLNLILDTVDRNEMSEIKNEQMLEEDEDSNSLQEMPSKEVGLNSQQKKCETKHWGELPGFTPKVRKQTLISAPERRLLREEFLQEMYSSFMEGRDTEIDYDSIDNDEQYDDLQQASQDAEDQYFDSETNEVENLEDHMKLVEEYGRKKSTGNISVAEDPLDEFMRHIAIKQHSSC
ncbi:coiled-coil domain-containing protein 97 [Hyposmocoma kahamanoa]|uniref:coiled-coil domain-containing protein 97 n=1 Tax=Hyposmocoma kahamanoa TaxID=1477025 RepID=UPI000E6D9700|nr:coiled-coil domain-containing protein 97 [Hyposmocoma kahamanoa]